MVNLGTPSREGESKSVGRADADAEGTGKIVKGDAVDVLPRLNVTYDAVITDPPYGIDVGAEEQDDRLNRKIENDRTIEDSTKILENVIDLTLPNTRENSPFLIFAGTKNVCDAVEAVVESRLNYVQRLVWDKDWIGLGGDKHQWRNNHEYIIYASNGEPRMENENRHDGDVLTFQRLDGSNKLHPTQKPTSLISYLIESVTRVGDVVLDPFAGAGTIPFTAQQMGRGYIGIEVDGEFYEKMETVLNQDRRLK